MAAWIWEEKLQIYRKVDSNITQYEDNSRIDDGGGRHAIMGAIIRTEVLKQTTAHDESSCN